MSILIHTPRPGSGRALNAETCLPSLSELPAKALSAAVPPADLSTLRARTTRIFQLGFNKCGTTSLYRFLQRSGISATRFNRGLLAARIEENIVAGRKPLAGEFARFAAFTDMHRLSRFSVIEGIQYFRQLHQYYPSSYFILNTRDKEGWLQSRLAHRGGTYAQRYARALKLPDEAAVVQRWSLDWDTHHQSVMDYFADKPGRLLVYDIKTGNPQDVVDFLAPDFITHARDFRHEVDAA